MVCVHTRNTKVYRQLSARFAVTICHRNRRPGDKWHRSGPEVEIGESATWTSPAHVGAPLVSFPWREEK